MGAVLCVGVGGFVGAVLRYGMGLVPFEGAFPWATFAVNLLGAVAIGALTEAAGRTEGLSSEALLFLKTGLCGGFTTFSTFSLETVELLEGGQLALGATYAGASLVCCLVGVLLGKVLARTVLGVLGLAE